MLRNRASRHLKHACRCYFPFSRVAENTGQISTYLLEWGVSFRDIAHQLLPMTPVKIDVPDKSRTTTVSSKLLAKIPGRSFGRLILQHPGMPIWQSSAQNSGREFCALSATWSRQADPQILSPYVPSREIRIFLEAWVPMSQVIDASLAES